MQESRAAGTKGVPRAEREQLMLDAAAAEFGCYGYAGAALSTIAAKAGVSKPLVLSYFGSKDGLFVACVQRAGTNLIDRIEAVLAAGAPPVQMAEDTLAAIFEGLQPLPQDWNVINDRTTPPGGIADVTVRRIRSTIADQAARGISAVANRNQLTDPDDVSALTDVWMSAVTALVGWWLRHPEQTAAEMTSRSRRILGTITGTGH